MKAFSTLSANGFRLFIYLADNRDNYMLELSSKYYHDLTGVDRGTLSKSVNELVEYGYLKQTDKVNFIFDEDGNDN